MKQIPIIDLAGSSEAPARFRSCAEQINRACLDTGFFGVVGHGVPSGTISDALRFTREFFDLPLEEKLKVKRARAEYNRAYIPSGTETLARLAGGETLPDAKEVFAIGPDRFPSDEYHTCAAAQPHWAPNQWPVCPAQFKTSALRYWDAMQVLKAKLNQLLEFALGLEPGYFATRTTRSPDHLRLIHYPAYEVGENPARPRAGAHTDLSMLTIIYSDNNEIGGLEVQDLDGRWISAPSFKGFMVNIGDTMMRWSNDRWKSTMHRVVAPPIDAGRVAQRFSLAFFAIPDYDMVIDCLPTCRSDTQPAIYEPITMGDYRASRFARTANAG